MYILVSETLFSSFAFAYRKPVTSSLRCNFTQSNAPPVYYYFRAPNENVGNAAKEISKEQSAAGVQETHKNPQGGSGFEPAQADGEGQGYSMKEVSEETVGEEFKGSEKFSKPQKKGAKKKGSVGEEAGVQDVE